MGKWIGVDLDGTLARFACDWESDYRNIGEPIPLMVNRVKAWLAEGRDVRIVTARADKSWKRGPDKKLVTLSQEEYKKEIQAIEAWCKKYIGAVLPITNAKDYDMEVLYDDRARQVEKDTGRLIEDGGGRRGSDPSYIATGGARGAEKVSNSKRLHGLFPGCNRGSI